MSERLRLAIQKSGRLSEKSRELLAQAGITCEWRGGRLDCRALDFPLDVILVRDDDIPQYVAAGICDLGIVGENVLTERLAEDPAATAAIQVVRRLGFGRCRLALAVPVAADLGKLADLAGRRIATSYPATLRQFLSRQGIAAEVVAIGGSVEVAPALGVAEAICDLVSSGATLASNGLREILTVAESEALLVATTRSLASGRSEAWARLEVRLSGVQRAARAKYIMMNAEAGAVDRIRGIIPGLEEPTVVPLAGGRGRVAIHAVSPEPIFWETMERLKAAGASSILVVPIEKIID